MPIDSDFPKNHQVIGKHKNADSEHYHFVWGPGRSDAETSTNPVVQAAGTFNEALSKGSAPPPHAH